MFKIVNANEVNYPELLYKFRTWNDKFHKRVLNENELYFSSPNLFNDPFDTKIYPNYGLLKTDEDIKNYINIEVIPTINKVLENNTIDTNYLYNRLSEVEKKIINGTWEIEMNKIWDDNYENNLGIISFSTEKNGVTPLSNLLLWSHYADQHKGFCVVFNGKNLGDAIIKWSSGNSGGYVQYEEYPQINPIGSDFQKSQYIKNTTKSPYWSYENEYRFIEVNIGIINRIFNFTNDCVSRVIVGCAASQSTYDEISAICKDKNWPIFKAIKRKYAFELDFE